LSPLGDARLLRGGVIEMETDIGLWNATPFEFLHDIDEGRFRSAFGLKLIPDYTPNANV